MNSLRKLKPLVLMQIRDKIDLSFLQSKRSTIIKTVLGILKFIIITGIFFLLFFICNLLSIFRPAGVIPDTVVNVIFVIIQLLSLVTCTAGLVNVLYMTEDNKVLLTMPASPSVVYLSKLVVYFIFELKKNLTFTLPVFLAYGIINGAVWYYYPWIILCFIPVSLIPVALGAILSIPTMFALNFIKNYKWLQFTLILAAASLIFWGLINLINKIPENINIMGQWGTIFLAIQNFLVSFSETFNVYYYVTRMLVGGTLRISAKLFALDTFAIFGCFIALLALLIALSFVLAKPLFVKMASRQFEFEKSAVKPRKNKQRSRYLSPFSESVTMSLRSTRFIVNSLIQLLLPAVAIFLLNKVYAAMSTNYNGHLMTKTFNFLVMLVLIISFNNEYATIYSKEGAARNLIKTRPIKPIFILSSRLYLRAIIIVLSTVGLTAAYLSLSDTDHTEIVLMGIITAITGLFHLLWCAETDIMHSCADQYATVGLQFDSPNERNLTIIGFILAAAFAFLYYFVSDRGTMHSLKVLLTISILFMAARLYLFIVRTKLYFVEN